MSTVARRTLWAPLAVGLVVPPVVIAALGAWEVWWIIPVGWACAFLGWIAGDGIG